MTTALLPLLFLLLTPEAPPASEAPAIEAADPRYEACVAGVRENVEQGRQAAMRWASEGGGAPAQHCLAVADLAAGFPRLAAIRLEELAERSDAGEPLVRARILSQSALAWVEAEELALASSAIERAFTYAPDAGELYLTLATVHAANARRQATIDAVTTAESEGFVSSEGYVLRGRARYALTNYVEAAEDVVAALSLDPFNTDALVLRGELRQAGVEIEAYYTNTGAADQD